MSHFPTLNEEDASDDDDEIMRRAKPTPPMTPDEFQDALDAIENADVLPWNFGTVCRETGIRPDRALDWLRGDDNIPPAARALAITLQSAEARELLYAANRAAKQQEDHAHVSHGN